MYRIRKAILWAALCSLLFTLPSCRTAPKDDPGLPKLEGYAIEHEMEFGGVYIKITIDDFNALGFRYGDSVDVAFSNGYVLEDIPYYNGYYVDAGYPLLIAYPGYDYIKAAVNYGDDLWETGDLYTPSGDSPKEEPEDSLWLKAGLEEHVTASVTLREKGKYADIQEARDIHYSDERSKYPSDVVFANFRCIHMGKIRDNVLFRSASPCDNQHKRAPFVDSLIAEKKVNCILNLADNENKIQGYIEKSDFQSPYFLSLYQDGKVIPLAMNMNYYSADFTEKIAKGLIAMSETEGPYLIHCTEGKDRTGFICMLVEALCGAGYQEIVDDYMLTYDNYYKINEKSEPAKYRTILEKNLLDMMKVVVGNDSIDLETADLSVYAREFLKKAGMSDQQVDRFLMRLCS
ncbi:MAG: tyrosine-protein phosphatase [Clostridia bacterium]|nr:tyrosine-protein phosphatase [Clostridia bacterium]